MISTCYLGEIIEKLIEIKENYRKVNKIEEKARIYCKLQLQYGNNDWQKWLSSIKSVKKKN